MNSSFLCTSSNVSPEQIFGSSSSSSFELFSCDEGEVHEPSDETVTTVVDGENKYDSSVAESSLLCSFCSSSSNRGFLPLSPASSFVRWVGVEAVETAGPHFG